MRKADLALVSEGTEKSLVIVHLIAKLNDMSK